MDLIQVTYPKTSLEEVTFQSTNEDSLDWLKDSTTKTHSTTRRSRGTLHCNGL